MLLQCNERTAVRSLCEGFLLSCERRDSHCYSGVNLVSNFDVYGSVHRKYIPIYIKQDATLHSLLYLETVLTVSGFTSTHHQEHIQLRS